MINLLPPEQKEEILLDKKRKLVLILGILSLLFLFSFILILLLIKIYLANEIQNQTPLLNLEKEEQEETNIKEIENKIKTSNQRISQVANFYQKQVFLSEILDRIQKTIPPGIYLTNFSFSKDNSQVTISGFSPDRETLFRFKKNLEENFKEVKIPTANWVESVNINFSGINFKTDK